MGHLPNDSLLCREYCAFPVDAEAGSALTHESHVRNDTNASDRSQAIARRVQRKRYVFQRTALMVDI
jgi:hypothetical protein